MMNPAALQLAAELGGTLLSGRREARAEASCWSSASRATACPRWPCWGAARRTCWSRLEAAERAQAAGLDLNLLALVPLPGCELAAALDLHRRRIGALVAALDAGLPWLEGKPMLVRRMPGPDLPAPPPCPSRRRPWGRWKRAS